MNAWDEANYCRYYDDLFPYDEDYPFYRRAMGDKPLRVLEIGAGSGRLTRVLLDEGHLVTALDSSSEMISRGKRALGNIPKLSWLRADANEYLRNTPEQQFDAVILALNTINEFRPAARTNLYAGMHRVLARPGLLLLQSFLPNEKYFASLDPSGVGGTRWESHGIQEVRGTENLVETSLAVRYDRARQALETEFRFTEFSANNQAADIYRTYATTYALFPGEVHTGLSLAGFTDITISGGFEGEPLTHSSTDMIVRARTV